MKKKIVTVLEIIGESLFYLIITYTLSSMSTSFDPHWYSIPFRAANIFALLKYSESMKRLTGSKFWTILLLVLNFILYALLAWNVGYIKGAFTPFTHIY